MNDASNSYQDRFKALCQGLERIKVFSQSWEWGCNNYFSVLKQLEPDLDNVMEWIYTLGITLRIYPNLRDTPEYLEFIRSSVNIIEQIEGHDWVNTFIGFISERLEKYDLDAGYYGWWDVPWRRSAIAFLLEQYPDAGIENYLKDNP